MAKKKKKEPKVEKVFDDKSEQVESSSQEENLNETEQTSDVDDILGEKTPEDNLTESQRKKLEKLNNVKNKISKILKSSNIEIIDENFDDEYDYGTADTRDGQSQQDYDSLKALYGGKDKNKKDELTLTIDDFDYTYIGQYLEEYDLMHMKNIKKVKIQKKRNPKLKKFLIISSVVLVVALGAVLGFLFTREEPVYLKAVTLSQKERVYNINGIFEDTGLFYYAEYSDGTIKKVKLEMSHFNSELSTGKFVKTGENNEDIMFENVGTANLVFTYEGFNVTYVVTVTRKNETGIQAVYNSKIFNLNNGDVITTDDMLWFFIEYEGDTEHPVYTDLSKSLVIIIDETEYTYQTGQTNGYRITGGSNTSSTIKIRYGNFEKTLEYGKSRV